MSASGANRGASLLPAWVTYWAIVASLLVSFDCLYVIGLYYNFKQFIPSTILSLWTWYGESDSQYSETGVRDGSGWIMTQSLFNVFEVIAQLAFVFLLGRNSVAGLLTILLSSMATLWKTLLYMSIIAYSYDPVYVVPGLTCFGYKAKPENVLQVNRALEKDNCAMQIFKFQFNIWWILVPICVIVVCCNSIVEAFWQLQKSGKKTA